MSPDKDKILSDSFPLLYKHRNSTPKAKPISFGFACDDGWFDLIFSLSEKLEGIIEALPENARPSVFQVKEKLGGMRFNMCSGWNGEPDTTPEMDSLISESEMLANSTCETCGRPGELRNRRYLLKTLCTECFEVWKNE